MQKVTTRDIDIALKKINIKKNSCYMVHSSLTHLGIIDGIKIKQIPKIILKLLRKNLGKNSTICFPTSDWDYSDNKKIFDKKRSNSHREFGGLSQYVAKKNGSLRSNNPLFNVTALGNKAKFITNGRTTNAFGVDSAWDKLYNLDAEIILLGCDFSKATFTFTRYIEFRYGVPYLYNKFFNIPISKNKKKIFNHSVSTLRYLDLNIEYDLNNFKKILKRKKILIENNNKKIKIIKVKMKPCFDAGIECLKKDINFFLKKKPNYKFTKYPIK